MRRKERILLIAATLIILVMAWGYYRNIKPNLENAEKGYAEKSMLNLNGSMDEKVLLKILSELDYFGDPVYERFLANRLKMKLQEKSLDNLGELNKRFFCVNAQEMAKEGGETGATRYLISATELGLDSALVAKLPSLQLGSEKAVMPENSGISITGNVENDKNAPVAGVLVRLREEIPQSVQDSILEDFLSKYKGDGAEDLMGLILADLDTIVKTPSYYVQTDKNGNFKFIHLEKGKNYSVIPIQAGKEYGVLRGVAQIKKTPKKGFSFQEKEHRLPLFDAKRFIQAKKDKVFTVRTPDTFRQNFVRSLFLFIIGFWIFHFALVLRKGGYDEFILPILMMLTGISLLVLYAIQDPLRDNDYGSSAALTILGVLILSTLPVFVKKNILVEKITFLSIKHLLYDKKMDPRVSKWLGLHKETQGYLWMFGSIVLILALAFFGSGPEGSNVKVNLGSIQISEVSKFFMILFFAYFFASNFLAFRNIGNNRYLIARYSLFMLIAFVGLIGLYIVVVGDQGPALVLCLTFLFFYAFAKNEFLLMIVGAVFFGVSLFIFSKIPGGGSLLPYFSGVVLIGLLFYSLMKKKHESLFFIILLISSFIFLELLPFDFAERLADRNNMFVNKWDNTLHGGDQVAQGVWALNSGGFFGQGLGKGFSNVMPAYHTDMIFETIGEEMGIFTLLIVLVLFGLLFYRSMLVARRTGNVLLFYLINGVAIVTLIQLCVIVGGSLGLMPLTGITVPFLSKGNSALMVNLAVFLVIIVLSQIKGDKTSLNYIKKNFDMLNVNIILTFFSLIVVFGMTLMIYLYMANDTMIRPVKVYSKQGEWIYSENPRISIVKNLLNAGSIYDRNGVLLATSNKDTFLLAKSVAEANLANMTSFEKQRKSIQKRYYPFSEDLIYWLGDANTGLVTSENLGYVAEYRLQSKLRGIEAPLKESISETSDKYREAPYLPYEEKKSILKKYDNSYYRKFLKAGLDSKMIEEENKKKNKDVFLTLDVRLNQIINNIIRSDEFKDYKTSVVAIKANSGDVLASAINPMPDAKDIRMLSEIKPAYYHILYTKAFCNRLVADKDFGLFHRSVPGSTIKVVDALAFLSRVGVRGADTTYYFTYPEKIGAHDPIGLVNMRRGIVESSNNYFISLMNKEELHPELFKLYNEVGINIANKGGYYIEKPTIYAEQDFNTKWYSYISKSKGVNFFNPKLQGTRYKYLGSDYSWISWGQGPVEATPLQMARLFGAIANHGKLYKNKFLYRDEFGVAPSELQIDLEIKPGITSKLEDFLKEQIASAKMSTAQYPVYGKTGSPERIEKIYNLKNRSSDFVGVTDGWYVFYMHNSKYDKSPIVFAIRIQGKGNSGNAVAIAKQIIEQLKANQFVLPI